MEYSDVQNDDKLINNVDTGTHTTLTMTSQTTEGRRKAPNAGTGFRKRQENVSGFNYERGIFIEAAVVIASKAQHS
jgi:hypothetical protein